MKPRTKLARVSGGDGGGKAADRREGDRRRMPRAQYRNWHVTEAASLRIGGVHTRDRVRPSIGARCGKAARRDLCGGAGVTRFPTALGLNPALGASQTIDLASSLPLAGQQVSYQDLLSNTGSVNGSLPTQTLTTGTYFIDKTNFLTAVIGANTITIINDETAGFLAAAFDGVTLNFSGADIGDASIDPLRAADFRGPVSFPPTASRSISVILGRSRVMSK